MTDAKDQLREQAVKGVAWVGGGQAVRQIVQVFTAIAFARLLVPEDFGLFGIAVAFVAFAQSLSDFGIGSALVQAKRVEQVELASSFWLNIVVFLVIAAVLLGAAPFAATFYEDERLTWVILAMSVSLLFAALTTVPNSILYREMAFPALAKAQTLGSLVGAAVGVVMAWSGYGVWSLVAQPIAGSAFTLVLIYRYASWWPSLVFNWDRIKGLVHFSLGVLGVGMLNEVNRKGDDLIIGKVLGSTMLGYYSLAYQLMLYPLGQISAVFVRVLFPSLVQVNEDPERFARGYLKAVGAIAVVVSPLVLGLAAVAEDFVAVVFGQDWLPMTETLQILCVVGMVQSITTVIGTVFMSTGRTGAMFKVSLYLTPVTVAAFLFGVQWGLEGAALAYAVMTVVSFVVNHLIAFKTTQLNMAGMMAVIWRPMVLATMMAFLVSGLLPVLAGWWGQEWITLRLIAGVVTGAILYLVLAYAFNRDQFMELVRLIMELRRAGGKKGEGEATP